MRIITRVAIFAALVFIFSYFSAFLYNINLGFFVVFAAGLIWGFWPGMGIGLIGYFLWLNFNPFGPSLLPIFLSQLLGISIIAMVGVLAGRFVKLKNWDKKSLIWLVFFGFISGLLYHLPVDIVDAAVYQPFWPRLIGGALFTVVTIISSAIIFPLFYPALIFMYRNDKKLIGKNNE